MKATFLDEQEDMQWLFDTHLKFAKDSVRFWWTDFLSAVIHGNEDCPQKIELFRKKSPSYTTSPKAIFVLQPDLTYKQTK